MRVALLSYHKNAEKLYEKSWIEEYKHSIDNQTFKDFHIFEMNYNGDNFRIFENSYFESVAMPTFVHALNYLLDKCFYSGYDYVFNSNCDDYFSINRIEKQLPYLEQGYDLVSSNFALVQDGQIIKYHKFHELNIEEELSKDHNCLCHPAMAYSKEFWKNNRYVPEEMKVEDLLLWKRALRSGSKIIIVEDCLLFHRLHNQSICQSENK